MFWTQNPSVLYSPDQVSQLLPLPEMQYSQKMNALTRLVFVITLFAMLFFNPTSVLLGGILGEIVIVIFFKWTMKNKEGLENMDVITNKPTVVMIDNPETKDKFLKTQFTPPSKKNPFANVLLTDISSDPKRKPAAPSFNNIVHDDIDAKTKSLIQHINPTIKDARQKLFGNVADNLDFEQSQRNFYSTANTRINNDQSAFANWLYGSMISAKESDPSALLRGNPRHTLY